MKVNVTLDEQGIKDLVKLMAAMPSTKDEFGVVVAITPQDALREALRRSAKVLR